MNGHRPFVVLFAAAVFASASCLCAADKRFYSAEKGYSLEFPAGWSIERDSLGTDVIAIRDSGEARLVINVVTEQLPSVMSVDEYFATAMETAESFLTGFREHDRGGATLNGAPARWLIYSWEMSELQFKAIAYFLVKDRTGYVLTCGTAPASFDGALPIFRGIAATLRFDAARDAEEAASAPKGETRLDIKTASGAEDSEESRPQPAAPTPAAAVSSSFTLTVEQEGQPVEIVDHVVRLKKAPFALIITFSGPTGVMVNISQHPYSFELAAAGSQMGKIPGFTTFTAVEGLSNTYKEAHVSDTAPQYWFYSNPNLHRFDGVSAAENALVCRRTVAVLYLAEKRQTVPIEKYLGEALYVVIIKADRPHSLTAYKEHHREFLKITFIK